MNMAYQCFPVFPATLKKGIMETGKKKNYLHFITFITQYFQ